ncbi:MAG: hypothetical protein HY222_04460 [Thaumarchaeota archaeon]|nr:hypothetical protein [Nitrososphaerota archaeon]MBI3641628.1 hypothetical protein [Nitrososphaerota archaeon]
MELTSEFRHRIEDSIHEIITTIPTLKQEYPKLKNDWKFEHDLDFIYGSIIGQILGSSFTAFKMIYNREASSEEILMIGEIIESYFPIIRDEIIQHDTKQNT